MPTVPTKVDQATLDRWQKQAKEWARQLKKKLDDQRGDTIPIIPPKGWCSACDNDEEHEHKFRLP